MEAREKKYDVIIVGAGVAGLSAAAQLPKSARVLILSKAQPWECNTFYAQGGITIAKGAADVPAHIADTLSAGAGLNDPRAVELLSRQSLEIFEQLRAEGFPIDVDADGNPVLAREGGHSVSRIIHSGGDGTGRALHTHLIANLRHTLWKDACVVDLLVEDDGDASAGTSNAVIASPTQWGEPRSINSATEGDALESLADSTGGLPRVRVADARNDGDPSSLRDFGEAKVVAINNVTEGDALESRTDSTSGLCTARDFAARNDDFMTDSANGLCAARDFAARNDEKRQGAITARNDDSMTTHANRAESARRAPENNPAKPTKTCYGVTIATKHGVQNIYADHIIIASGGVGGLFKYHTNAYTISSDLHGIALSRGLALADMEMLQFHPSVFVDAPHARKILISEAVRGEGAMVVDARGRRFLFDYDKRGELAPRDIVARGIFRHCAKSGESRAFLDLSAFSQKGFRARFPNIYRDLQAARLDVPRVRVPILPAFHYSMGGIKVGLDGRVAGVRNLYAIGECASNGVHGANRLASNSLLEGLVFGRLVGRAVADSLSSGAFCLGSRHFPLCAEPLEKEGDLALKNVLRELMWSKVGILRSKEGLNAALGGVEVMAQGNIGRMLRLRLLVAKNIILSALNRPESLGAHCMV